MSSLLTRKNLVAIVLSLWRNRAMLQLENICEVSMKENRIGKR